jgi:hypothetical protein
MTRKHARGAVRDGDELPMATPFGSRSQNGKAMTLSMARLVD